MKKNIFIFVAVFVVLLLPVMFWISSLIKCEALTRKYYDDFEKAYTQNTMLGEMEYFKVLNCDSKTAEVYYVSKQNSAANLLTFDNVNGIWIVTSWRTIWSDSGSASEVVYPYWWHFIYSAL